MKVQSIVLNPRTAPGYDGIVTETVKHQEVLVEYKPSEDRFRPSTKLRDAAKIDKLAQIWHFDKSTEFCSLKCLHWFHDSYEHRFGLVFELPSPLSLPFATLFELFGPVHKKVRPTLGQRFRLAHDIGRAVEKWHSVRWVHEGICSRNIVVFQNPETQTWEFSKPFLGGFHYSRHQTDFSNCSKVEEFRNNVYRHPDRQGVPTKRHDALHDIYAYGVLLLETGLWQPILEHRYIQPLLKASDSIHRETFQQELIKIAKQSLGHTVGADYRDAVVTCLGDEFESLWGDDRTQPRLEQIFKTQVLDKIENGFGLR